MPFPEYTGYTAEEILAIKYVPDSAWHIHVALCWCDYAERKRSPQALHYAGYHLRTGIEHLWFDVLISAQGAHMSFSEYEECLRSTTKLYKLIDARSPSYVRFAEFTKLLASLDSISHPPSVIWDISRLKRIHGECGGLLLHFQGVPERGYLGGAWIESRTRFLFDSACWIFRTMQERGNLVIYNPDGLKKPEVFSIWEQYRDARLSVEDATLRLRIIQPIVRKRP
jgi:hypothetical protein